MNIQRGDPEELVFGKVYGIFRLTGNNALNGRVFVCISYYEYVNNVSGGFHSKLKTLHLKHAVDTKNDKDRMKRWWDVIPAECIVKKIHLLKDHGSKGEDRYFVNWDPLMH